MKQKNEAVVSVPKRKSNRNLEPLKDAPKIGGVEWIDDRCVDVQKNSFMDFDFVL